MVNQAAGKSSYHQPVDVLSKQKSTYQTHSLRYRRHNFIRAWNSWILPYIKMRFHPKTFRPVLSFLYTDLNCNLDCHYCYSRGHKVEGMSMQTAIDALDWLHSSGCRVVAYMGGEPLVRKQFIIDLTRYAVRKGFFVYLPTNGILLDEAFIDEIGKAGIATINLAVDAVDGYQGIPKYFSRIKKQFEYLVQQREKYGYITFFNINITRKNIEDVKNLTHLARSYGVPTDYHINEPPLIKYETYKHEHDGEWITDEEIEDVMALIDWLIEKNLEGYAMVNSVDHLDAMKLYSLNQLSPWSCMAGQITMIIRLDGSFSPCMELFGSTEDWGNIYDGPKFDSVRLLRQKQKCNSRCLSTCNYQVHHYTQSMIYSLQWVAKHAYVNFFGIS